jgi:protein-tyrosine-phosphatase
MLDLKQLEEQRKKYREDLDNLTKLQGEEKQILAEKERIEKMISDAGYKSSEDVKKAVENIEKEIQELTEKIKSKTA